VFDDLTSGVQGDASLLGRTSTDDANPQLSECLSHVIASFGTR